MTDFYVRSLLNVTHDPTYIYINMNMSHDNIHLAFSITVTYLS